MQAVDVPAASGPSGLRPRRPDARLQAIRLLPAVSQPLTAALAALVVTTSLMPVAFTLTTGALVGTLPAALRQGLAAPAGRRLAWLLAAMALLVVADRADGSATGHVGARVAFRVNGHVIGRAMRAALRPPGIAHLEDAETQQRILAARGMLGLAPGNFVFGLWGVAGVWIGALGSAAVLATFRWWLPVGLLAVYMPARRALFRRDT